MGLLDFITKAQNKLNSVQNQIENFPNMSVERINSAISSPKKTESTPKKNRTAKMIIDRFYSNYPEPPYVSNDRDKQWIERAETFPSQSLVEKNMMMRYSDGLLPGHVYMLYWLNKYTGKKVPAYFEYKYGIHFESEKAFLKAQGFLGESNKPTEKGKEAIENHYDVIENHSKPRPKYTREDVAKQILQQRDSFVRNGFKEFVFIANSNCCETCKALNGKHFKVSKLEIGVNAPPMHDGCRCSLAAYEDREEYEEWLNNR